MTAPVTFSGLARADEVAARTSELNTYAAHVLRPSLIYAPLQKGVTWP